MPLWLGPDLSWPRWNLERCYSSKLFLLKLVQIKFGIVKLGKGTTWHRRDLVNVKLNPDLIRIKINWIRTKLGPDIFREISSILSQTCGNLLEQFFSNVFVSPHFREIILTSPRSRGPLYQLLQNILGLYWYCPSRQFLLMNLARRIIFVVKESCPSC